MSTEAKLLGILRRKRRVVAALLLPALLAWVATGSACVASTHVAPASHEQGAHGHAAHHAQHHIATPQHHSPDAPCPHCPSGGTVATSMHACATTDGAGAKLTSAPLPDPTTPLLAPAWVPLPTTPAPPLIRFAAPPRGAIDTPVPLNLLHCVLLI